MNQEEKQIEIPNESQMSDTTTQEKILAAARAEFIDHGLRGARMQQIADRAGLNKALLHYHFRNKEGLYVAALKSVFQGVVHGLMSKPSQPHMSEEEKIRTLIRAYVFVLKDHLDLAKMAMRELTDGGLYLDTMMEGLVDVASRIFPDLWSSLGLAKLGSLTEEYPRHFIINVMSMVWGTFLLEPIYTRVVRGMGVLLVCDDTFYEQRVDSIVAMVVALRTGNE